MKRMGYRFGVEWIAENDEPEETSQNEMERLLSVALLADLFSVTVEKVAKDVIRKRKKWSKQ